LISLPRRLRLPSAGHNHQQESETMNSKPPNHGLYQVWHEGKVHVLDVDSVGVREVERLTRQKPERWKDAVTLHTDNPRPTRTGDVIVDPERGA